jgi:hypothetical protein
MVENIFKNLIFGTFSVLWIRIQWGPWIRIRIHNLDPDHRAPTHFPLPLRVAKTGKNHLNEEITSLLPTGIGERFSQSKSNLGHAVLLRQCELPLLIKVLNFFPLRSRFRRAKITHKHRKALDVLF